jgi:hypothetical protein
MTFSLRDQLRRRLSSGFWYPPFVRFVDSAYKRLSLGYGWNRWLAIGDSSPDGASESYQAAWLILAAIWVTFIYSVATLSGRLFVWLGIGLALYRISEIFLFAVHWVFAAKKDLSATRRSLAGFLVNLLELSVLFTVLSILGRCSDTVSRWTIWNEHLRSIWTLELIPTSGSQSCRVFAQYEVVVAGALLLIVVASLVGGVIRPERAA